MDIFVALGLEDGGGNEGDGDELLVDTRGSHDVCA